MEERDKNRIRLHTRLLHILRRHCRDEDLGATDHEFVTKVWERYLKERGQPLIDPNE